MPKFGALPWVRTPAAVDPVPLRRIDALLHSRENMPRWMRIAYISDRPPEARVSASDFDFVDGAWMDVRREPDVSNLLPEMVVEFSNVWHDARGGIWLPDGRVVMSPLLNARMRLPYDRARRGKRVVKRKPSQQEFSGEWATIAQPSPGFGHWFIHRLSRLATLKRHFPELPIMSSPLTYSGGLVWDALGIDRTSVHLLPKAHRGVVRVEKLLVPTFAQPPILPRVIDAPRMTEDVDAFLAGVNAKLTNKQSAFANGFPERVFMARKTNAKRAGCGNASKLQAVFERRGFVSVDIAALSVSDQMALMANVQQIAGEVGSFSMNALFAPPGLGVITVATGSGPGLNEYVPGAKTYTRAVTDFGQHHQRRIVANTGIRQNGWIADIDVVERALDSMPEIPSR